MQCKKKKEKKKRVSGLFFGEDKILFYFFQIVFAARSWKLAHGQAIVNRCAFVKMLLKSRADSKAKKYLVEIRRFLAWCKQNSVADSHSLFSTVVILYLFQLFTH